jgi:hypothetical protein
MNEKKIVATVLQAIGAVLILGSLMADAIGIGGAAGFGTKQVLGATTGVILALVGFIVYSRKHTLR